MPATKVPEYTVEVAQVFTLLDKLERDTRALMSALDELRKRIQETTDASE